MTDDTAGKPALLVPGIPLPESAYTPGQGPRPAADEEAPLPRVDPARWQECRPYLRGIDLFNHGFYWEAHECWEAVWNGLGRRGETADFIKALIALAAAALKIRQGRPRGVRSHGIRAATFLAAWPDTMSCMGLMPSALRREAERLAAASPPWDGKRVVLPFVLIPR
jgi:hypothetical protein